MSSLLPLLCLLTTAAEISPSPPLPDEFDEPAVRLAPKIPRSEQDQDQVVSAALYAHGRLLLQRRDYAQALRRFQRAWRYDPEAVSILPRIVFLAHQLRRPDEAARYALIAAQRTPMSVALLRQLAVQLSGRQAWEEALVLFEKSLQAGGPQAAQPKAKDEDEDLAALLVYLEMGRLSLLTRDYAKSAEYFARVRDAIEHPERLAKNEAVKKALLGEADRTYRLMAEGFFQAGRYDEAEALYRRAYQGPSGKDQPGLLDLQLARVAAKRGQTDQALQHLEGYFAAKSSAAGGEPYTLLAELLAAKEPDKAKAQEQLRSRLEKLLEGDATNTALLFAVAELDRQAGRFEPAERRYEQLLVLQATPEVYAALVDIFRQQNRPEKLIELCGIIVAKGGSLAELADVLEPVDKSKEQSEAVIARVRQQRESDPEHLAAGAALAAALLAQTHRDSQTADALFTHAASRLDPPARAETLLAWGLRLLLDRAYERAVPPFRQALTENLPDERKLAANFYLTRALALAGQNDEALQVAGQAAAAAPDAPRLQAQPGWVQYHAKRYAEAEQAYQALLERFDGQHQSPDVRDTMRDARLVLSNLCVQRNNMEAAEEWLEQVLDEFPDDIGALNDLGYLWVDQNKHLQRALDMVRRAVDGEPDNVAYRDSLGWALYRLGRYPEAVQELEKAAAGDDPDGVILDHLGDAYRKVNRRPDAVAAWRRAVEAFAKEDDQAKRQATQQKIETCEK